MKFVHTLPAVFTVGCMLLVIPFMFGLVLAIMGGLSVWQQQYMEPGCNMGWVAVFFGGVIMLISLLPLLLYSLLILIDSSIRNHSLWVGILSIPASFIQLLGYGLGFLSAFWKRIVLKKKEEGFDNNERLYK